MSSSFFHRIVRRFLCCSLAQEDIAYILNKAKEQHTIDDESIRFALAAVGMTESKVRDIMTPDAQIVAAQPEQSLHDNIQTILASGFSRFPVINKQGKVEGFLFLKDLFSALSERLLHHVPELEKEDLIRSLMQTALVVPESRKINGLLKEMKVKRKQAAIVVDEYGTPSGLVSIEDILEEIVGEIEDEHDSKADTIVFDAKNNCFYVDATAEIEEINTRFHTSIEDDKFDTIGGMILHRLGHFPREGEVVHEQHLTLTVAQASERHIKSLRVTSSKKIGKH